MRVQQRAFVALAAAGAFALASPAAGMQAAPRAACAKTYTYLMFRRAAITAYRGTRTPSRRDLRHLRHFQRCARHPWQVGQDRRVWQLSIRMNAARKQAALAVPESALARCIIERESGGNPQAVNGQYEGIAQWSPSSWIGGGGGRFAPTPLGATYAEQVIILNDMLPAQAGQWTPYDGC